MAFSFFQRGNLRELARQLEVTSYVPTLELHGLVPGVDNLRYDVFLSPLFTEVARQHIQRVMAVSANIQDLLSEAPTPFRPPSVVTRQVQTAAADVADFKRRLVELQTAALNRAKAEGNVSLDLLARVAVLKFLRSELLDTYASTLERLRARQRSCEGPQHSTNARSQLIRQRCVAFQLNKRIILRRTAQELLHTLRDVEKETLARLRRSLFGAADLPGYELFINDLLFTDNGRDDSVNAEHYVMFGNFDKDSDRYSRMLEIARGFLVTVGIESPGLDAVLSNPDNAHELVAAGMPDESTDKGMSQKALLEAWTDLLESENVLDSVIAAYEAVPLVADYAPTVNPQQLKNALISRAERARVEALIAEQGKLSSASFQAAVRRAALYRAADKQKIAGRFLLDFTRYTRDLRRLEALNSAMDTVSVVVNAKLRNLSEINSTLYEFLLPEEQRPAEDKIVNHIIVKADIRDSTTLTRTLFERGLNPASYFTLNFYDPVNTLLPKYEASKVFIEGDAIILALFEREGEASFGVARACVLAREMINIVRAYNEKSQQAGLPTLELGIGISFQDSPPMYLMDGSSQIMISKAINESDRLSSCNKGSRQALNERKSLFNVYCFQTVEDQDTGGNPDEFLMRYNIGGICLSAAAFHKVQTEISLEPVDLSPPTLWKGEAVQLYTGLVPLSTGAFQRIVVREGVVPRIEVSKFVVKRWTERKYYEVCTTDAIYEDVQARLKQKPSAQTRAAAPAP